MNELFQSVQDNAPNTTPFMMAAAVGAKQINQTRVVEAVITALVSGAVISAAGYLFALPKLEQQVNQVTQQVTQVAQRATESTNEIKADIKEVRVDVKAMNERQQRLEIEVARRLPPQRPDRQ